MWVQSLGREDPLAKEIATHSSTLAWKIPMNRGAWWATVYGVAKSWTQLKQLGMHISYMSSVWLEKKWIILKRWNSAHTSVCLYVEKWARNSDKEMATQTWSIIFFCLLKELLKELLLICTAGQCSFTLIVTFDVFYLISKLIIWGSCAS